MNMSKLSNKKKKNNQTRLKFFIHNHWTPYMLAMELWRNIYQEMSILSMVDTLIKKLPLLAPFGFNWLNRWRRRQMAIHIPPPSPPPFPPPHASCSLPFKPIYGAAASPRRRRVLRSLGLYCQLSDHQTTPQVAIPSRTSRISRSSLSVSETSSEVELWAATCLRVRTFYDFNEQTFGIEVSAMLKSLYNFGFISSQRQFGRFSISVN